MFELGKQYNFTTLVPSVLGGGYKLCKVVRLALGSEMMSEADIGGIHTSILPQLPPNTPQSIDNLPCVKFETQDGKPLILAQAWIDASTVIEVSAATIVVTIHGESLDLVDDLRTSLELKGVKKFTIEVQ